MEKTNHSTAGSKPSENTEFHKIGSEASVGKPHQAEQLEIAQSVPRGVRRRRPIRRHCARFWLWWLVGFVVFSAIFLPLL